MNSLDILSRNLKILRKQQGMSQDALAFHANIARSYMSDIERKATNPTLKTVDKLAKALGVEPYELLKP